MSKLEEWMQKLMWYVEEMREEWINVCRPLWRCRCNENKWKMTSYRWWMK